MATKQDGRTDPEDSLTANDSTNVKPTDDGAAGPASPANLTARGTRCRRKRSRGFSSPTRRAAWPRRREQFGPNALAQAKGRSALSILAGQFKSLIVVLLLVVTVVAFALVENVEGAVVLVVIALNAVVGFLTEWKAERALTALQRQAVATAHVLRDGHEHEVPAADLVPGDVRRRSHSS